MKLRTAQQPVLDRETLESFVGNLDVIFAEVELEKEGGGVEIFFDTADVRDAALGMRAFYENNAFVPKSFDDPRALVQALAARGDLGPFQLLSAHQAEFLALMSIDFGLRSVPDLADFASTFLQDAHILKKAVSLSSLTSEQISEIVQDQVGNAANFFKAVEAIRGDWRWRLRKWRASGIMHISSTPDDYSHLMTSDRFRPINEAFDNRRAGLSDNNFADAVALVALMKKVEAFNGSEGKHRREGAMAKPRTFPCFYAATPQFSRIAKKVGFEDLLEVVLPGGARASVIRGTEYFVLRAIARASRRAAADGSDEMLFTEDVLRMIHAEMRDMLDAQKTLPPDQAANVQRTARTPMHELIRSVKELSFFDNVWLPYRAEEDTRRALGIFRDAFLDREHVQSDLRIAVEEVRSEMQTNGERFRSARFLWRELPARYRQQRSFLHGHTERESMLLRRTGLVRFSFPSQLHGSILTAINGLLSSSKPLARSALSNVVTAYLSAFDHPDREAHASVAAAALWVAGKMDGEILRLLRHRKHDPRERHFSLDLVYAAAAVHSGTELGAALHAYSDLERRLAASSDTTRADIAMGLAYLYYHLWNRARNNPITSQTARARLGLDHPQLIERAVLRATDAFAIIPDNEKEQIKRVYLLNQIVYFKTLSGAYIREEIEPLADQLAEYTEHREDLWEYRYDDTLARFYLFAAESITDAKGRRVYLELAEARAADARGASPDDEEVKTTYELVKKRVARRAEFPDAVPAPRPA